MLRYTKILICCLALVVFCGTFAQAETYNFTQGVNGYQHLGCQMFSIASSGNGHYGAMAEMLVGNSTIDGGNVGLIRSLLDFTTDTIPDGSVVTDVQLTLTVNRTDIATAMQPLELQEMDPPVVVNEVECSWNRPEIGYVWSGGDPIAPALSTCALTGSEAAGSVITFTSTPELVALAQAAIDGDDRIEMVLMSPGTELIMDIRNFIGFHSDDAADVNMRPVLSITTVPEPGTLSLIMVLSGVLLSVYRRRNR